MEGLEVFALPMQHYKFNRWFGGVASHGVGRLLT